MKDYIVSATAANGEIRAFCCATTQLVQEATNFHNLTPVTAAALGRGLTAATIMSKMLKSKNHKLTLQFKGDGPMGGMVIVTNSEAKVRGYVHNADVVLPPNSKGKLDVSGALGKKGYLNVIKDYGLKEPYIGFVNLVSGEIAEDIAYYFASSEQTPSAVALGVLVNPDGSIAFAGGYMIQLLPDAQEKTVQYLEERLLNLPSVTNMLNDRMTPEDILQHILKDLHLKITEKTACGYECYCSRERMEVNLISLGITELKNLCEEQNFAELVCHFCNKKYLFYKDELQELIYTVETNQT